MSDPVKKTPYQGKKRVRGFFHCDFGHRWISNWSWANRGQRCAECAERNSGKKRINFQRNDVIKIKFTYPHAQEPLADILFYCETCELEDESQYPKPIKCTECGEIMSRVVFLNCPFCDYEHGWIEDPKKAYVYEFVCKDYAEKGKGCDEIISKKMADEIREKTGSHLNVLCEECDQLACSCNRRSKSRKRRNKVKKEPNTKSQEALENNSPPSESASRKKNKKRSRRRKKKSADSYEDKLCNSFEKL